MGRARRAISALAELAPDTASCATASARCRSATCVRGDVIVVRPNARIAADGFVLAGTAASTRRR